MFGDIINLPSNKEHSNSMATIISHGGQLGQFTIKFYIKASAPSLTWQQVIESMLTPVN